MFYKRLEYFRYTFGKPLEAKFRIIIANSNGKESKMGDCSLVDLSPGGAKLFANFDIPLEHDPVKIHLQFTLNETQIDASGPLVWKKPYQGGHLYGFDFEEDEVREELIVAELKLLRKSEIEAKKK